MQQVQEQLRAANIQVTPQILQQQQQQRRQISQADFDAMSFNELFQVGTSVFNALEKKKMTPVPVKIHQETVSEKGMAQKGAAATSAMREFKKNVDKVKRKFGTLAQDCKDAGEKLYTVQTLAKKRKLEKEAEVEAEKAKDDIAAARKRAKAAKAKTATDAEVQAVDLFGDAALEGLV